MTAPRSVVAVARAWPRSRTQPQPDPAPPWPDHALVVAFRTVRPGGGALTYGMARLVGPGQGPEPTWSFYGRGILASQARRYFGEGNPHPVFLEDFLEEGVRRCCQKPPLRAAFVSWSVPSFVSAGAWSVDAKGDAYRFTLRTWTNPKDGITRPDFYRSRIRVAPSSSGVAQVGFDRPRDPTPRTS